MPAASRTGSGLTFALLSAATFGTSGVFATSLLDAGWSSGAAVTARLVVAALALTPAAVLALRGRWSLLRAGAVPVLVYGLVAVAGCQLFYFNAVSRLSVGVALLLEYLGSVLVVGWLWLRHGRRPRPLTLVGAGLAVLGLGLVLDVLGSVRLDPVGVLWGLCAAVGLAAYYVLSAGTDDPLPPIVLAWGALAVGALALLLASAVGVVPFAAPGGPVVVLDHRVSWLVPVLGLALVAAAFAYVAGIAAARLLGPTVASFVGLSEVLFAVLFAWLLLDEVPAPVQLLGGAVVVGGVALVRLDELRGERVLVGS